MPAQSRHHESHRRLMALLLTTLLATAGCTTAAPPTPTAPAASPAPAWAPPPASPSTVPSPSPTPLASPSASPSSSAEPAVGLAPDGTWTGLRWQDLHQGLPVRSNDLEVFGWSHGFVALEQSPGSDADGNDLPVSVRVSSSADGIHWPRPTSIRSGLHGMTRIEQVVEGPSGLLALAFPYGDTCGGPEPLTAMWTSSDGATWDPVPMPGSFVAGAVHTIAGGDSGFIALGAKVAVGDQALWTSADGRTWTARKLPTISSGTLALDDASSFADGFVLVGSVLGEGECGGPSHLHPATWFSSDGSAWTRTSLPGASTDKHASLAVQTLLGRLLVVQRLPGDETRMPAWTSIDGRTWIAAGPVSADGAWATVSDGRHTVMVVYPDGGGAPSVVGLDEHGRSVALSVTGDGPVQTDGSPGTIVAVGPTGILATTKDGSKTWLGIPSS